MSNDNQEIIKSMMKITSRIAPIYGGIYVIRYRESHRVQTIISPSKRVDLLRTLYFGIVEATYLAPHSVGTMLNKIHDKLREWGIKNDLTGSDTDFFFDALFNKNKTFPKSDSYKMNNALTRSEELSDKLEESYEMHIVDSYAAIICPNGQNTITYFSDKNVVEALAYAVVAIAQLLNVSPFDMLGAFNERSRQHPQRMTKKEDRIQLIKSAPYNRGAYSRYLGINFFEQSIKKGIDMLNTEDVKGFFGEIETQYGWYTILDKNMTLSLLHNDLTDMVGDIESQFKLNHSEFATWMDNFTVSFDHRGIIDLNGDKVELDSGKNEPISTRELFKSSENAEFIERMDDYYQYLIKHAIIQSYMFRIDYQDHSVIIADHNQDEENIRWIYGLLMKGLYEALPKGAISEALLMHAPSIIRK